MDQDWINSVLAVREVGPRAVAQKPREDGEHVVYGGQDLVTFAANTSDLLRELMDKVRTLDEEGKSGGSGRGNNRVTGRRCGHRRKLLQEKLKTSLRRREKREAKITPAAQGKDGHKHGNDGERVEQREREGEKETEEGGEPRSLMELPLSYFMGTAFSESLMQDLLSSLADGDDEQPTCSSGLRTEPLHYQQEPQHLFTNYWTSSDMFE